MASACLVASSPPVDPGEHPVVFFDGDCGFCNKSVQWLLRRDPKGILRFAPLQGETAAGVVTTQDREQMKSVVLWDEAGLHRRSTAFVRILRRLGGRYRLLAGLLAVIPRIFRDLGYDLVAASRSILPSGRKLCQMPRPEERARLLP